MLSGDERLRVIDNTGVDDGGRRGEGVGFPRPTYYIRVCPRAGTTGRSGVVGRGDACGFGGNYRNSRGLKLHFKSGTEQNNGGGGGGFNECRINMRIAAAAAAAADDKCKIDVNQAQKPKPILGF